MTTSTRWTSARWASAEFAEELRAFVVSAVGEPSVLEPLTVRPWSTVWRVETAEGRFFAKQNCPGQAHEAELLLALARIAPEYVVPVVAADPTRDLLLTADGGPTVRETHGAQDVDQWCRIVADAADLQRRLTEHVAELPLKVLLPGDATTYVADAAGRLGALDLADPRRLDPGTLHRLEALLPTIDRWSDEVADLGLPITLNHNDLHENNVLAGERLRFFDFGDAVLTEPLGSILVPINACSYAFDAGPDDARLRRIAAAALEVWTDLAPARALWRALPASLQLGRIAKVESWRRCVATMTEDELQEYGDAPAGWLGTLLSDPPVGTDPGM